MTKFAVSMFKVLATSFGGAAKFNLPWCGTSMTGSPKTNWDLEPPPAEALVRFDQLDDVPVWVLNERCLSIRLWHVRRFLDHATGRSPRRPR